MLAALAAPLLVAQQATPTGPDMTSHSQTVTFKAAVQLVTIPVVVRDAQGRAVGNLGKDDYWLNLIRASQLRVRTWVLVLTCNDKRYIV